MKLFGTILFSWLVFTLPAQHIQLGLFAGGANYLGDLQDKAYDLNMARLTIGGNAAYLINNKIAIRGSVLKANIAASDALARNPSNVRRNLSFATRVYEVSIVGKYSFLDLSTSFFTPYITGGLAGFRFNPYAFASDGSKQYLMPLSTEGQGLPQFPDQKKVNMWQMSLPFGAGLEFKLSDYFTAEIELAYRKTFTDYLDDVSQSYINPSILLAERGPRAVEMAYRGGELPGGNPTFPREGTSRGNPNAKDWYYTTVIRLNYLFGGRDGGSQFSGFWGKSKKQYGCPNVW